MQPILFLQYLQCFSKKHNIFPERGVYFDSEILLEFPMGGGGGGNSWPQREIVLNVNTNFLKLEKEKILPFFFRNKMFKIYRANQNRLLFLWETFVTDKKEWHKKCLRLRERESKKFNIQEEHLAVQLEVKIKKYKCGIILDKTARLIIRLYLVGLYWICLWFDKLKQSTNSEMAILSR